MMLRTALAIAFLVGASAASAGSWELQLASRTYDGDTANSGSTLKAVGGADGRYVVIDSAATNLTAAGVDDNNTTDTFVCDGQSQSCLLVSHAAGLPTTSANAASAGVGVSDDGRFVLIQSTATNLVAGAYDGNAASDLFLFDRSSGDLTLVSHQAGNSAATANAASRGTAISADGRYVLYSSDATDLIAGGADFAGTSDVFLYDRINNQSTLLSSIGNDHLRTAGVATPRLLSPDGRYVAFTSASALLVTGIVKSGGAAETYVYDRVADTLKLATHRPGQPLAASEDSTAPVAMTADGDWLLINTGGLQVVGGITNGLSNSVVLFQRSSDSYQVVSHAVGQTTVNGNQSSYGVALSADGRYALFNSDATNLVAGASDTDGDRDALLYDRTSGNARLVSHLYGNPAVAVGGVATGLSDDGSQALIHSSGAGASVENLSSYYYGRVYGYDRTLDRLSLLSVAGSANSSWQNTTSSVRISRDGHVAFYSSYQVDFLPGTHDSNYMGADLVAVDIASGTRRLLSRAAHPALTAAYGYGYAITDDGRKVSLSSDSKAMVPDYVDGNPINPDSFLFDLDSGTNTLVSRSTDRPNVGPLSYSFQPRVSGDGTHVAFASKARDILPGQVEVSSNVDVFLFDRASGTNRMETHVANQPLVAANGTSAYPRSIGANGRFTLYVSDASNLIGGGHDGNGGTDAFLFDNDLGINFLVSHAAGRYNDSGNAPSDPVTSTPDGYRVLFNSDAGDLINGEIDANGASDVFMFEFGGGEYLVSHKADTPLTTAAGDSRGRALSPDSRYVLFDSDAYDLVTGMIDANASHDVFLWERYSGAIQLISHAAGTAERTANGRSVGAAVSADGRYALFSSDATDLVAGVVDVNQGDDVFLADRTTGEVRLLSRSATDPLHTGSAGSTAVTLSADGRFAVFDSDAADLVAATSDLNGSSDVFVYDRLNDTVTPLSRSRVTTAQRLANGESSAVAITPGGGAILFRSIASDLVPGALDTNGDLDTFVARYLVTLSIAGPAAGRVPELPIRVPYQSGYTLTVPLQPGEVLSGCGGHAVGSSYVIPTISEDCQLQLIDAATAAPMFVDGFE